MKKDSEKDKYRTLRVEQRRALEAATPLQLGVHDPEISNERLREMALIDFVTDPDQKPVSAHYARLDRPWRKYVEQGTFLGWAAQGKWSDRRAQWWSQIEARILAKRAEQMASQRVAEIEAMESARENMMRYLFPLTDKKGFVRLHPELESDGSDNPLAGLPVYGLRMPSLDRFVTAFIALDKQIMLKRGEATERAAGVLGASPVDAHESDQVAAMTPEDLRAMARVLVRRRQPELNDQPEIEVSALGNRRGNDA